MYENQNRHLNLPGWSHFIRRTHAVVRRGSLFASVQDKLSESVLLCSEHGILMQLMEPDGARWIFAAVPLCPCDCSSRWCRRRCLETSRRVLGLCLWQVTLTTFFLSSVSLPGRSWRSGAVLWGVPNRSHLSRHQAVRALPSLWFRPKPPSLWWLHT